MINAQKPRSRFAVAALDLGPPEPPALVPLSEDERWRMWTSAWAEEERLKAQYCQKRAPQAQPKRSFAGWFLWIISRENA